MKKSGVLLLVMVFVLAIALGACSGAGTAVPSESAGAPATEAPASAAVSEAPASEAPSEAATGEGLTFANPIPAPDKITTLGPDGKVANWYTDLALTAEEVQKVKDMNLKAGFELINASEWDNANLKGFQDACKLLNIDIIGNANCELDPIKQKTNMEQFAALNLDIMTCQPQDLDVAAATFDPLYEQGVKMVYMSNVPTGYEAGKQYVGAITDSLYDMGKDAADMMAEAIGSEGKILSIRVAGTNYVCNTRDDAFEQTIKESYPNIEIVEVGGFQSADEAGTVSSALLTKYPDVKGIYVSYSNPCIDVLQTVKSLNRDDIKIITMDLDTTCCLDMAQGGNIAGIAVDLPYDMGFGRALMGVYGALGKECPAYVASPSFKATRDNLEEAYMRSFGTEPPQEVLDALNQ